MGWMWGFKGRGLERGTERREGREASETEWSLGPTSPHLQTVPQGPPGLLYVQEWKWGAVCEPQLPPQGRHGERPSSHFSDKLSASGVLKLDMCCGSWAERLEGAEIHFPPSITMEAAPLSSRLGLFSLSSWLLRWKTAALPGSRGRGKCGSQVGGQAGQPGDGAPTLLPRGSAGPESCKGRRGLPGPAEGKQGQK